MIRGFCDDCFDKQTMDMIRCHALRLLKKTAFQRDELEDIFQDLAEILLRRASKFAPHRGHWHTFVSVVLKNAALDLHDNRRALKRNRQSEVNILDVYVLRDGNGEADEWDILCRPIDLMEEEINQCTVNDWLCILKSLPLSLQDLVKQLLTMSVSDIARKRGKSRASVYKDIKKLRAILKSTPEIAFRGR